MIIPHRPYNILTGEWRSKGQHLTYLGNEYEEWDPQRVLDEAKFLHFSDWPVPKPWLQAAEKVKSEKEPKCDADKVSGEMTDCRARDIWRGFYADFATRREVRLIFTVQTLLCGWKRRGKDEKHEAESHVIISNSESLLLALAIFSDQLLITKGKNKANWLNRKFVVYRSTAESAILLTNKI